MDSLWLVSQGKEKQDIERPVVDIQHHRNYAERINFIDAMVELPVVQQTEQVAWWTLGIVAFVILAVAGSLLAMTYRGIIKRLESLEKVLGEISKFLSGQEVRNEVYQETKERMDRLEVRVIVIEERHKHCLKL